MWKAEHVVANNLAHETAEVCVKEEVIFIIFSFIKRSWFLAQVQIL